MAIDSRTVTEIQQEVFDICARHMLETVMPKLIEMESKGIHWADVRQPELVSYFHIDLDVRTYITSPTHWLIEHVGVCALEDEYARNKPTIADGISAISDYKDLCYLGTVTSSILDEDAIDVRELLECIEEVFAAVPVVSWAERLVVIARKYFIRWDRDFIAAHLVDPASKPSENMKRPLTADEILATIRGRSANEPSELTKQVKAIFGDGEKTQAQAYPEIGKWFTFVTETTPPHLVYGQLTQVDTRYTIDHRDGRTTYVFEVTAQTSREEPETHSIHDFGNVIMEGDTIHYTKLSEVIKKMISRLS